MKQEFFRIGIFVNTHGIRGEIKVYPTTDDLHRFDVLKSVIFDTKKGRLTFDVEGVKYFKGMAILKLSGVDRIEDIEPYKGCDLLVAREDAIPLEEGEHYIADLIGMRVIEDTGRQLGVLRDVLTTGANDVYIVDRGEGAKDLLIPVIPDCVLEINTDEDYIRVHLLDGLEDL